MKITYGPVDINNFHHAPALSLIISGKKTLSPIGDYRVYRISKNQARKIANHFCGIADCHCPHGAVEILDGNGTEYGIRAAWCE